MPIIGFTGGTTDPPTLASASLIDIMECAARCANAGWKSTAGAGSTTTQLIDPTLVDNEYDASSWGNLYLYRPNAVDDGNKRRRAVEDPYVMAVGTLTVATARAWTVAPATAEVYYAFGLVPPHPMAGVAYSWRQAVNDGLRSERYVDDVSLGTGDQYGKYAFSVSGTIPSVRSLDHVRKVRVRRDVDAAHSVYSYQDAHKGDRWVEKRIDEGAVTVYLFPAPGAEETVYVEVLRPYVGATEVVADATSIPCALALACAATRRQLFEMLGPRYTAQRDAALLDLEQLRERVDPAIWM